MKNHWRTTRSSNTTSSMHAMHRISDGTHCIPTTMPTDLPRRSLHNSPERLKNPLHYASPRIDVPDAALFPSANELSSSLERWKYMAQLAGRHQQPHDFLRVNLQRVSSPQALAAGVPSSIGSNIQKLHLPLTDASLLPEWLDAISTVFPNLLHLYFTTDPATSDPTETGNSSSAAAVPENDTTTTSKTRTLSDETLVRRLYVLYRLPRLKSMDGQPFSEQEKKLSRPMDRSSPQEPAEEPPERMKDANVSCLLDESSDEEDVAVIANNREVEIGLNGKPMACDPDRWEYASVESSAVACEWGCGISSLPYFQRNGNKKKTKKSQWKTNRTTPPQQYAMRLNQFTFEDSIEVDDSTASEVYRISPTPNEALLERNESPVSSSSSHCKSQQSNQENVASRLPPTRSLTSPFPMQFRSARRVTERVEKIIGSISDESETPSPKNGTTRDTIDHHRPAIPLTRIRSSPSNLEGNAPHYFSTSRPPPVPGRRAPLGTRPQRTKRRQNRWRERLTARSNSIFDDEEEISDTSDGKEAEAVPLEPKGIRLT